MAKNEKYPRRYCVDCGMHIPSQHYGLGRPDVPLCIGCDDLLLMQRRIRKDAEGWIRDFQVALAAIAEREKGRDKGFPVIRPITEKELRQLERPLLQHSGHPVVLGKTMHAAPTRTDGRDLDAPAAAQRQRLRERQRP